MPSQLPIISKYGKNIRCVQHTSISICTLGNALHSFIRFAIKKKKFLIETERKLEKNTHELRCDYSKGFVTAASCDSSLGSGMVQSEHESVEGSVLRGRDGLSTRRCTFGRRNLSCPRLIRRYQLGSAEEILRKIPEKEHKYGGLKFNQNISRRIDEDGVSCNPIFYLRQPSNAQVTVSERDD